MLPKKLNYLFGTARVKCFSQMIEVFLVERSHDAEGYLGEQ